MLKKIIFHGKLKELLPEPVEIDADSPLEAMRGLVTMYPHLQKIISFKDRPIVQIVGFECKQSLTQHTDIKELHVVPAMFGAGGRSGFLQIVIGSIIIAATLLSFGAATAGLAVAWNAAMASSVGSMMIGMGASMILGGLISFLSPSPSRDIGDVGDPEASKYLGAGQNTARIGTRIPIAYGTNRVYGHYISFDVQAKDVAV